MRSLLLRSIGVVLAVAILAGCKTIPEGRMSVDRVDVRGADALSAGDVEDAIATTESPKFLGLFRGVLYEYSTFDRHVLQRDLARVEAFYRSKGFYEARARAGRVHVVDDQHIRVEIVVEEGPPVLVRGTEVDGLDGVPPSIAEAARRGAASALPAGSRFEEERFTIAQGNVLRALTDRGFAYTKVAPDAAVDLVAHRADAFFKVEPGVACTFGRVTIEGLGELPEPPVRRAVDIKEGARYSQAELESAQQAVLELGVFASVEVTPELAEPPPPAGRCVVPVNVKVEPTRLRTLRLGGGLEFDALKTDIHAIAGWESRNFLGGMRTFSIRFRPGVVLYPLRANNLELPNRLLPEERLRLELRQPGFVEARTTGFVRPEFNVQGVFLDPNPPPGARVLGYAESRNAVGVDRTIWKMFGVLSHNVQVAYPFTYVGTRDPTLGMLVISYPELLTNFDLRDDRVHPRKGVFLGNTLQVAGGPFGGQARDVKVQPDVRGYVPLARGVVLAARGTRRLQLPQNNRDVVRDPQPGAPSSEARTRDYQLTFFRGFFSGGPTQNRGYPLRGIGPHDIVPFISPELAAESANCAELGIECRTPTGGFTLWEASTELRFAVAGPLSVATFCDASDVSPRSTDIRFKHLHLSCGGGARYDTPVGPVRLDVGYRIPGLQVIGGLTPDERKPDTFAFDVPIAIHLGIGEAY